MSDSALSSSGTGGLGTVMLAVPSKKVRLFVLLFLPDLFALSLSLSARADFWNQRAPQQTNVLF